MEAHLAGCETCRAIAADLRGVCERPTQCSVASAPDSLRTPHVGRSRALVLPFIRWRPSGVAMAGLGVAAAALIVVTATVQRGSVVPARVVAEPMLAMPEAKDGRRAGAARGVVGGGLGEPLPAPAVPRPQTANESLEVSLAQGQASTATRGPMVIRTATIRIVIKEYGNVRTTVEGIVAQAGGFVDRLTVDGDTATARTLSGSLRVPSDRMSGVLDRLRQLGQVVEDTQGSEEVTEQIVDLDARLASARATEQRLTDLLKNRTGRLSDVLSVERELARVRLDIERLDAEKTNTTRRVTYATIAIQISEERKQGLETGALPLSTRIRVAAADGAADEIESVVGIGLFILRAGPSLLIWGIVAVAAWMAMRRTLARRGTAKEILS
jgi:hypothetical protein